jgi:hypothetical protein
MSRSSARRLSAVAYSPRMRVAALPGSTWMATKTISEMRTRTSAIDSVRLTT